MEVTVQNNKSGNQGSGRNGKNISATSAIAANLEGGQLSITVLFNTFVCTFAFIFF